MRITPRTSISDAMLLATNVPEDDADEYDAGNPYALKERCIVVGANIHLVFESVYDGANTGNNPLDEENPEQPVYWLEVGATNPWRMFDGFVSSQTEYPEVISTTLLMDAFVTDVGLLNMDGTSARVTQTDVVDGTVYEQEVDLVSDSGILDYFEYWFNPVQKLSDYTFEGLYLYNPSTITIEVFNDNGIAKVGAAILGQTQEFGPAEYGLELGRTDYSDVSETVFGNITITKRGNVRNMTMTVMVPNASLALFDKLLSQYLSTPAMYRGLDDLAEATTVLAIYQTYSLLVQYKDESLLSISLKGLI